MKQVIDDDSGEDLTDRCEHLETRFGSDASPVRPGSCLAGIFVGGKSSRMHGVPKGLLRPPEGGLRLVERLRDELNFAGAQEIVLVGAHDAYASIGLPMLPDSPLGQGPMSGLLALVDYAGREHYEFVLAMACDMPAVDRTMLRRLVHEHREAAALVPRRSQFEPLCARYRVANLQSHLLRLIECGHYRMMQLLDALGSGCVAFEVEPSRYPILADWDAPEDLPEGVTYRGQPIGRLAKRR